MSMVGIEIAYEGDLHTVARHEPSGSELATDAPVDNQGRGESFSPTDLLATAVGTCMMTVMGIRARREGWALDGARVRVEKGMVADPVRRVGRLAVHVSMPSGLPEAAREVLPQIAEGCPVMQSIHPSIETGVHFDWAD